MSIVSNRSTQAEGILGVYYAVDEGAVCDGQQDDAGALAKALAKAKAAGGGRVLLPGGGKTVLVGSTVKIPSNTWLVVPAGTTLKLAPDANCDLVQNDDQANGNAGCGIAGGGTLDGNRANQSGTCHVVNFKKVTDCRIGDVVVKSGRTNGINLDTCTRGEVGARCVTTDNGSHGVALVSTVRARVFGTHYDNCRVAAAGSADGVNLSGTSTDNLVDVVAYDTADAAGRQGYGVREAAASGCDRNALYGALAGNKTGTTSVVGASSGSVLYGNTNLPTGGATFGGSVTVTSGVFTAPVGSAAAPSLTFVGRTTDGVYSSAAGEVSIATGGVQRVRAFSGGVDIIGHSSVHFEGVNNSLAVVMDLTTATQKSTAATVGAFSISSNDAANSLNIGIGLTTDPTATNRSAFIQVQESGIAFRNLVLQPSGGSVVIANGASVSSGVLALPVGSAAAPSLTFVGRTTDGVYSSAAGEVSIATGGTQRVVVGSTGMTARTTTSTSYVGLSLTNDASRRLDINYAGSGYVGAILAGGPSGETAMIATSGANVLQFGTNGTSRWYIDASGNLLAATDNQYNIGASGANRPANVYVAGAVVVGTNPATTGAIRLANGAGVYARNSANTADFALIGTSGDSVVVGDPFANLSVGTSGTLTLGGSLGTTNWNSNNATIVFNGGGMSPGGLSPTDNKLNLGGSSNRWIAVYAVNGTIQTSSREWKENIEALPPGDALGLIRRTRVVAFNYRGSPWRQVGFVAEDTDPLLTLDGKSASPQSTASLALAGIQELDRRLRAVEAVLA